MDANQTAVGVRRQDNRVEFGGLPFQAGDEFPHFIRRFCGMGRHIVRTGNNDTGLTVFARVFTVDPPVKQLLQFQDEILRDFKTV
jgi:hypothetical protein